MPLVLHIGTGKTGTSSVQRFLFNNRAALGARGLVYPEAGLSNIEHFGESIAAHYKLVDSIKRRDKAATIKLRTAIEQAGAATMVFSCENFYHHLLAEDIQHLRSVLADQEVRIICYVRPQDQYIESAWKQQVKVGDLRVPFRHFFERHCSEEFLSESHANYNRKLAPWAEQFGDDQIDLRVFDRSRFVNGELIDDFLRSCVVDLRRSDFDGGADGLSNQALPTELILLLRFVNWRRYFDIKQQASFVSFLQNSFDFGNQPMLGPAERRAVLENYRPDNERMFARYGVQGDGAMPDCFTPNAADLEVQPLAPLPQVDDIAMRCLIQAWRAGQPEAQRPSPPALKGAMFNGWWDKITRSKR